MKTFQVPVNVSYQQTIVLEAKDYDDAADEAEARMKERLEIDPRKAHIEAGDPIEL